MSETLLVCSGCEHETDQETDYCPNCGAGPDPWEDRPQYDFERDVSLPLVFSSEVYDDNYELWRDFCCAAFGHGDIVSNEIANFPDGMPRMKYQVLTVYYKLDESLELHGPHLTERAAREA